MRLILFFWFTCLNFVVFANPVHPYTLDNGLNILVKEDHRAPVAVVMIWYKVGSADDPAGLTGISHVLEHLMFKGTPSIPQGIFSKTIASIGGQENAFTNNDYTAYFEKIAAKDIEQTFKLEADRMQNLILDAHEFEQEMKVIQEERRMRTEDNPQALTFERFLAAAHLTTPYHQPVIGWMNDLEHLTIQDVRQWYKQHYAPNYATLVVIGDVDANQVHKFAQQYFGSLKASTPKGFKPQIEPPTLGKKTIEVHTNAQLPLLMKGYTVPSVKSAVSDEKHIPYALEVIAGILDAGESGRLQRELVRKQLCASSIGAQYNLYTRYDTQFIIYATPTQKCNLVQLDQAILKQLQRLASEKVPSSELKRVKTQLIAEKIFERDSIFGQAMELGILETIGLNWRIAQDYEQQLQKISADEIQTIAKQYFKDINETNAHLIPTQGGQS